MTKTPLNINDVIVEKIQVKMLKRPSLRNINDTAEKQCQHDLKKSKSKC